MKTIPTEQNGWNTNKGCYSESIRSENCVWVKMTLKDLKLLEKIKRKTQKEVK